MSDDYKNFIFNKEAVFIFSYVPKVACSNWKCILRYMIGAEDYLDTSLAHDRKRSGLTYLSDISDPIPLLSDRSIQKFACVRDPYSRILSAYLNKIESRIKNLNVESEKDYFDTVVQSIDQFRLNNCDVNKYPQIQFEIFLRWLLAGPKWLTCDEHWRSQSELLMINYVKYDFIGKFETLISDSNAILHKIGCDIVFPSQEQIRFAPTKANEKLERYYTHACVSLTQEIFADDFDNFGYSPNSPALS